MFNTTVYNHDRHVDVRKTVIEKRAPTDESVRLLKEMETKAFEKLLGNFEVKNNIVSGNIIFFKSVYDMNLKYRVKFKINNIDIYYDGTIENGEVFLKNNDEIIKLFINKVSEMMALKLVEDNVNEVSKNLLM